MPLSLAPLPQGIGGPDLQNLVLQINDRLRRIAANAATGQGEQGERGMPGAPGAQGPPGTSGGSRGITEQVPVGTIDGTNTVFKISESPAGVLLLFLNGVEQNKGTDFSIAADTITYAVAPQPGDWHIAVFGTTQAGADAPGDPNDIIYNLNGKFAGNPNFQYVGNNVVLTGPAGSGYIGEDFNSYAKGTDYAFQQNDGTFYVTGAGDGYFQNLIVHATFNSQATGATAAIQQVNGAFIIYGSGDAQFQSVKATTTFNSLADTAPNPAATAAFQTSGGDFIVYGDGHFQGQQLSLTTPLAPQYGGTGISAIGPAGTVLLGGSPYSWGKVPAGSVLAPGLNTQVILNENGQLGTSTLLTFDYTAGILTVGTGGVIAPLFNSGASGGANAFQTGNGNMHITGAGDGFFQNLTVTKTFNSLATGATAAIQQSGGSFIIYGSGDAQFQTVKATTTFNSLADTAPSPAATAAFQTSGGSFIVYGDGHFQGQRLTLTTPLAPQYGGTGIATVGAAGQVLLGGSPYSWGKVDLGSMVTGSLPGASVAAPGANTQIIYNAAGVFGATANFTYNAASSVLAIAGPSGSGVQAQVFTASGDPSSHIAFQTNPTNFQVDTSGNVTGQGIVTAGNYFRANSNGYYVGGNQIINGAGTFVGAGVNCPSNGIVGSTITANGTMFCQSNLSITGFTSSAGQASFTGYVSTGDKFVCSGSNGVTTTFRDQAGTLHQVVGGIITS